MRQTTPRHFAGITVAYTPSFTPGPVDCRRCSWISKPLHLTDLHREQDSALAEMVTFDSVRNWQKAGGWRLESALGNASAEAFGVLLCCIAPNTAEPCFERNRWLSTRAISSSNCSFRRCEGMSLVKLRPRPSSFITGSTRAHPASPPSAARCPQPAPILITHVSLQTCSMRSIRARPNTVFPALYPTVQD